MTQRGRKAGRRSKQRPDGNERNSSSRGSEPFGVSCGTEPSRTGSRATRSSRISRSRASDTINGSGRRSGVHANGSADGDGVCPSLDVSVLVLNRFYLAVHVINARRSITLLYRELAEVLDVEDGQYFNYDFASWIELSTLRADQKDPIDDWIRSVSFELQVPRVIRLLHYDRIPRHTLRFNRRNLFARDGHRCQYCGNTPPSQQLSLDHVMPRSRGGGNSWENVVCCCVRCNTRKGGRTPQEARMNLLNPPHKPTQSPMLINKLQNPKYVTWRAFISSASANYASPKN